MAKHDVKHLARKAGTVVINDKTEEMKKLEEESDTKTGVTKQGNEAEDDDLSQKIDVNASKKRKREM